MLAFIQHENDVDFKIAIYSHADGYQVQLIDGVELTEDVILPKDKVQNLAKAYGFELPTFWNFTQGRTYVENQSRVF